MEKMILNHPGRSKRMNFSFFFSFINTYNLSFGLPLWLSGKESACNAGDLGSIPGSGRSPGEGNGNPLQYSCFQNSTARGAWWGTVHGVAQS